MKISSIRDAVQWAQPVRENEASDGHSGQKRGSGNQQESSQERKSKDGSETFQATSEKLNAAIDSFSQDSQAQTNGLRVEKEGQGPGLRVVLRDGSGAVVRQFTGEEFVQLREAAMQDAKPRGRLLDRKL